jgi:hypothetical protein
MSASSASVVYQLRVVLRDVSPLIWRRLLVCSSSLIADLHYALQIAFGWGDTHLHRFVIHGKAYGIAQPGGIGFADDPCRVRLADFAFRRGERFAYQYDFGDNWCHDLRVEQILPHDPARTYPGCVGGARAAPPEDCGGPWAYLDLRQRHHPALVAARLAAILGAVLDADDPDVVIDDHRAEMSGLLRWATADRFDRRHVNRRLAWYAVGDDRWWSEGEEGRFREGAHPARH